MGLIRLLLAVSVYLNHTSPFYGLTFVGGTMAVQAFYMISGFYMALILSEKYTGNNRYRLFIANRFLRLYPTFLIIVLMTLVSAWLYHTSPFGSWEQYDPLMSIWTKMFLVFTQIPLIGQDLLMFCKVDPTTGALQYASTLAGDKQCNEFMVIRTAWTIGIEMWFYLLAPFIVRYRTRTIWLLIAASFLVRFIVYFGFDLHVDPWTYRFFPAELAIFLFGILGYRLYRLIRARRLNLWYGRVAWLAVVLLTILLGNHPENPTLYLLIYYPIIALSLPFIFHSTKRWWLDRFIGELSYPLYLSHLFFIEFNQRVWQHYNHYELLVISLIFSAAIVVTIEKPIDRWRQVRVSKMKALQEITAP